MKSYFRVAFFATAFAAAAVVLVDLAGALATVFGAGFAGAVFRVVVGFAVALATLVFTAGFGFTTAAAFCLAVALAGAGAASSKVCRSMIPKSL